MVDYELSQISGSSYDGLVDYLKELEFDREVEVLFPQTPLDCALNLRFVSSSLAEKVMAGLFVTCDDVTVRRPVVKIVKLNQAIYLDEL